MDINEDDGAEIVLEGDENEVVSDDFNATGAQEVDSDGALEEDAGEEPKESEAEQYGKSVQKRISRLTEKYRNEERLGQEATRVANALLQENNELKSKLERLDSGFLNEYGARTEAQLNAATRAYKEAHDTGDSDAMVKAQQALTRATTDVDRHAIAARRAQEQAEQQQRSQPQANEQQFQQPQQQYEAPPPVDEKAAAWTEKNEWFGNDEVMTYAALSHHNKLVEQEGFDPTSQEYYAEIDSRMRSDFPQKFEAPKPRGGTRVAPAGSSASRNANPGRRTVKLSAAQVRMAKRLNVPVEEYAKYVKQEN